MKLLLTLFLFLASNAGAFDVVGSLPQGLGDGRYVQKAGDTMSGPLTLSGSSLTVTGNAFSVGGSTLVVSNGGTTLGGTLYANLPGYAGKVGIGTVSPQTTLGVVGGVQISSSAAIAPAMAAGVREGIHFTHTVADGISRITGSYGANNGKLQIVADTTDIYSGAGNLNVAIPSAVVTTGGALCLNASHVLSKCTSAVDASGNCTCP